MTLLQRVADHGQLMTGQPVSLPNQEVFFCLSLWEIRPVEMRHSERRWFPYLSRGKQYAMAIAFLVFLSLPAAARILSYLSNMYWEKSLTIPSMNTFSGPVIAVQSQIPTCHPKYISLDTPNGRGVYYVMEPWANLEMRQLILYRIQLTFH